MPYMGIPVKLQRGESSFMYKFKRFAPPSTMAYNRIPGWSCYIMVEMQLSDPTSGNATQVYSDSRSGYTFSMWKVNDNVQSFTLNGSSAYCIDILEFPKQISDLNIIQPRSAEISNYTMTPAKRFIILTLGHYSNGQTYHQQNWIDIEDPVQGQPFFSEIANGFWAEKDTRVTLYLGSTCHGLLECEF